MQLLHSRMKYEFLGGEVPFAKCAAVLLPAPYDGTTSFVAGARDGPHAIITASRQLETYDDELECETYSKGIWTLDELEPGVDGPKQAIARVQEAVEQIIEAKKLPIMLGGEHSLTLGAINALKKKHPKMGVIQFDAHSDLREEFEDSRYSHACVMRHISEQGIPCGQIGIRNTTAEEVDYAKKAGIVTLYAKDKAKWNLKKLLASLPEEVYITFDIDAFDSSLMPATGTPQPGGLFWEETVALIKAIFENKKVIGFDVMELAPIPGMQAPNMVAAKLVQRMFGYATCLKK